MKTLLTTSILCCLLHIAVAQTPSGSDQLTADKAAAAASLSHFKPEARGENGLRVMFYNTENFYDTVDDPLTKDEEYLPTSKTHWTFERYETKLNHIYKVIASLGGWELPDLIGFSEVENRSVLEDLLRRTPLERSNLRIVHENSADVRGIDVALLYNPAKFTYLSHRIFRPHFPFDTAARTRDILYVKGLAAGKDTLHVFVNHWPSRRGGQDASEPRRNFVASIVRAQCDSLFALNPQANILIMGDMNDEADNASISEVLRAKGNPDSLGATDCYAYMYKLSKNWTLGSEKYREHWGIIDHIIVSAPLFKRQQGGLTADPQGAQIYSADFLLTEDEKYFGLKPLRTYSGPVYIGGFSDHLPVYLDLFHKH